jgi:Domain of unknown function (DUF4232)
MRQKWMGGIAIMIGFMLTACMSQAGSHGSPSLRQSETAVVAAKATDRSNHQATLAAMPSATPTVKPPAGVVLPCDTANLSASAVSEGATGAMTFTILIANQGQTACKLQGMPQVQIVDQQGEPLVLQAIPFCFECSLTAQSAATPAPGGQTSAPDAATATAQAVFQRPVILGVGKSARLFLIWRNWCPPFPSDGVNLLMSLPAGLGELTIPTDAHTGGRCDAPAAGSSLSISQFLP